MSGEWADLIKRYRLRHGLTQGRLAAVIGVSQRTVSRWERGEDRPSIALQKHLRDLGWAPPAPLLASLVQAVRHCPVPRALSRMPRLRLLALSGPALAKRPAMREWIGRDLAPNARGILAEMLDDRALQRSIAAGEIACVEAITRSVLDTGERARVGAYQTVVSYFFHDGTLYSDAISTPAPARARLGYAAVPMDEVGPGA
jgi:transcriptional regulator with XRE-family HTH domain